MIKITENIWEIESDLTSKTVPTIFKKYASYLNKLDKLWVINLSKCKKIDSAGLSLLIEYIKYAQSESIELQLKAINNKATSLAKVHGVKNILENFISK